MNYTIKPNHETLKLICDLYDVSKGQFDKEQLDLSEIKYLEVLEDLLGEMIVKFKKKLLENKSAYQFQLKKYQVYFLSRFIYENYEKYQGIFEKTLMRKFADRMDIQLC